MDNPWPDVPAVSYDEDLVRLRIVDSIRQLQKLRKQRVFPIPELPRLDRKHRYARPDVISYLNRELPVRTIRRAS